MGAPALVLPLPKGSRGKDTFQAFLLKQQLSQSTSTVNQLRLQRSAGTAPTLGMQKGSKYILIENTEQAYPGNSEIGHSPNSLTFN